MKISVSAIQKMSEINNSIYSDIKLEFLYHSNKLEGSTFNIDQLNMLIDENLIVGEHTTDDVQETINSLELFDFVIKTLNEELTPYLIREWQSMLLKNTKYDRQGLIGIYKKIPNKLRGINLETAQPYEVAEKIDNLFLEKVESLKDITHFHQEFEHIHPFQDGNGRIGRFIILRQCLINNIDLIAIDNEYNKQYKDALYIAQTTGNENNLMDVFEKCQKRLHNKLEKYEYYINELNDNGRKFIV